MTGHKHSAKEGSDPVAVLARLHEFWRTQERSKKTAVQKIKPVSVLDLPAPWLVQLILQSDDTSLLALFQTCATFRDLVLQHAPKGSSLTLRPVHWGWAKSVKALHLPHQRGTRGLQTLTCNDPVPTAPSIPNNMWQMSVGSNMLALLHAGHSMGILDTVTRLNLSGVALAAPLLPLLDDCLPNMTMFTLTSSTIDWQRATADSFTGEFTRLQHLCLEGVTEAGSFESWQEDLEQQLAQLTSLTDLTLYVCEDDDDGSVVRAMGEAAMPSVAGQLTRLALHTLSGYLNTPSSCAELAAHLTALQVLLLPDVVADDEDMRWMLDLPVLQHLQVDTFSLSQSWAGKSCRWRTLSCNRFFTYDVALLPLHDQLVMKEHNTPCVRLTLDKLDTITTSAGAVARSGLPNWHTVAVEESEVDAGVEVDLCFQLALPLLVTAKDLSVECAGVSISSVAVYLQAAAARQQAIRLRLPYTCKGSDANIAELVRRMPAGSELVLGYVRADEDMLMRLCKARRQGVTLRVGIQKLGKGYQQRVQAVIRQQGHLNAQLQPYQSAQGSNLIKVWDATPVVRHSSPGCIPASSLSSDTPAACSSQSGTMVSMARHIAHGSCSSDLGGESDLGFPVRWLVLLIKQLDANSLLALFQTCKAFRHLVLRYTRRTFLSLQPALIGKARSLTALQLVHKHSSQVHLTINNSTAVQLAEAACVSLLTVLDREPHGLIRRTICKELATHALSVLQAGHFMGILNVVTELHLLGVELATPLLPLFSSSMPKLKRLNLHNCTIDRSQATEDSFKGSFSKLHYLSLIGVRESGQHVSWQQHLQQQVRMLTSLRALTLQPDDSDEGTIQTFSAVLPAAADQLTYLAVHTEMFGHPATDCFDTPSSRAQLAVHLTALKVLKLPQLWIGDQDMRWLLNLPSLQQLQVCRFCLRQSWAKKRCRWLEVTCTDLHTDALARLPLHSKLLFKGSLAPSIRLVLGTAESVAAAVKAVVRSRLPGWHAVEVHKWDAMEGNVDQRFLLALPLLASTCTLVLEEPGLSMDGVLASVWFLATAQHQQLHLTISSACRASVADTAMLISRMPAGNELDLSYLKADEDMLVKLCSAAKHRITLRVYTQELEAGYEQRINAALAQRGHPAALIVGHGRSCLGLLCHM